MTTQAQTKHHKHKASYENTIRNKSSRSAVSKKVELFFIAVQMKKAGLSDSFLVNAVQAALEFEGVSDLMHLWEKEKDKNEKNEIIADIQDMIDACSHKEKSEEMYVKCNDLDAISRNIRAFKDALYQEVMARGGITKLASLTGIPQPSLSRFFNSSSVPRRSTILKIGKVLELGEIKLDILKGKSSRSTKWEK